MYNKQEKILKFPKDFLWGTSTSAYQTEGNIKNDWSEWETKNADRLAKKARAYWQPWQREKFPEMFRRDNYICGQACDSYNRYEEDFNLAKDLNNNAIRFGIEWARIEPKKGKWSMKEIEHYKKVLQAAKKRNLKVVLTLWHWTNPVWLVNQGGWSNKKVIEYFSRYVELVVKELGELVDYWVTLNEPMMIIGHGYIDGKFPPNKKMNFLKSLKVLKNFIRVHKISYNLIHKKFKKAKVSIAMTTGYFEPAHKWCLNEILLTKLASYFRNDWFLKKIKDYYDYIGVNYYHHNRIVWHPPFKKNLNKEVDDRGWEIYPEGIYQILKNYMKYKKPMIVLENGTADADDKHRDKFITNHLKYIREAIAEGADVRGYFYWSLLDNFEWAEGYWPKFGLYKVDRETFKRIPRSSAEIYAEICKSNSIKI